MAVMPKLVTFQATPSKACHLHRAVGQVWKQQIQVLVVASTFWRVSLDYDGDTEMVQQCPTDLHGNKEATMS
eukprot:CCRYP_014941-RA/>CCRYP_014941-RA protein AED:0.07 eAED:0.07 QI:3804/0.5/0.66/1/0.5/0.33/3/0/71